MQAKAATDCNVFLLKRKNFIQLLKKFPDDYEHYRQMYDKIKINNNLQPLQSVFCNLCKK